MNLIEQFLPVANLQSPFEFVSKHNFGTRKWWVSLERNRKGVPSKTTRPLGKAGASSQVEMMDGQTAQVSEPDEL